MTKEGPSPRKETLWTSLSLSRVGPARPCAQVGKGHPSVRKVDPMLLQLAGRVKPSTPCCPCTLQKSFRHDKPETSSRQYYNPMRMRHGFSKQRVNIYVMVWLKNYCDKKRSDRTSLNHRNVEYRIDQDGADLNFLGKGRNFLLSLHFSKESCASFCLSSHVFSFLVLVIFQ